MPRRRIEQMLLETIGLDAASLGPSAVDIAVRTRMRTLGITSIADYVPTLLASAPEQRALIEEIVVSESWFFREPAAYHLLAERFASEAKKGATLKVLSIPCATGEEPYSVVMTLLEAGVPASLIEVWGVDVSAKAVQRAQAGVYSRMSFRQELGAHARHFQMNAGDATLSAAVRSCVKFTLGNVLDPTLLAGHSFHAILCRNLLIYLDRPARATALRHLRRLLKPEGILLVGHSEASEVSLHDFARTGEHRSFAFVRRAVGTARPAPNHSGIEGNEAQMRGVRGATKYVKRASLRAQSPSLRPSLPRRDPSRAESRRSFRPRTPEGARRIALEARALADRGELALAVSTCANALALAPDADVHSLMGVLRHAQGDLEAARTCFEQALTLEANHHEALVYLALLAEAAGDLEAANAYRDRAATSGG